MIRTLILLCALATSVSASATLQQTARPGSVSYDGRSFLIDGKPVFIYSGAFHYFRCPKPLWRDRLQKIKEAHFNTIETVVPWNWHERRQGQTNLRDFEDYLKLAERVGFYVIARPGPYICAEWDAGGFPTWLPGRTASLRDNSPDSVRWSRYWFDQVLPVIRRHQLGHAGTVIMVQLENEYDYYPGANDTEKKAYIRTLYKIAKDDGIDVPFITCWTRQVRDRTDPDMRHIIDCDNFYPRSDVKSVLPQLDQLGRQQPDAPRVVTELQGGWFSQIGGPLSIDQPGITPEQQNAITKTVWSGGATAVNYYMLFGGTNFGYWGGKGITTTYDYGAPIREPGGLWDKYYVVRAAGKFAELFGAVLARATVVTEGPYTDMPGVSVIERANGSTGFLFLRSDAEQPRSGLVTAVDPASGRPFDIAVHLEARGAKILPINAKVGSTLIQRTNAEVAGYYRVGTKPLIVLAGDPGETIQATFGSGRALGPGVSATLPADPLANPDQMVEGPYGTLVLFTTSARAARISEVKSDRGTEWPVCGGFYRLADSGATDDRMTFDAEVTAGKYDVSIPLPRNASRIRVNGADVPFTMGQDGMVRFQVDPGLPDIPPLHLGPVKQSKEMWGGGSGWKPVTLRPLDELGVLDNGYTRYRTLFTWRGEKDLVLAQYANDPILLAVNGTPVPTESAGPSSLRADISRVARQGINRVEVLYENAGRPNFGDKSIWERKGLKSASLGTTNGGEQLTGWEMADRLQGQLKGWVNSSVPGPSWPHAYLPDRRTDRSNTVRWYRTSFRLPAAQTTKFIGPWKLKMDAGGEALIYVNGYPVGRYSDRGPQTEFYLPEPWLHTGGNPNIVAVAIRDGAQPAGLRSIAVQPYGEYTTRKMAVSVDF